MAELSRKLGKLSLAILENFVEKNLGKKFVDELGASKDRVLAIAAALENAEERFVKEYEDRTFAEKIFTQVNDRYIGLLSEVVGEFYDNPTKPGFPGTLARIISDSFPSIDRDRIDRAVQHYVNILTEELALADQTFRENARALADLRGERSQQEMVEILRRVETLLSEREIAKAAPSIFHPLHQLPQPPADFTGREALIARLLEDFKAHRGATITGKAIYGLAGMGGIGKTALGLVVAHKIKDDFPDAQIFLDLKGTTEPLSAIDIMRHVVLSFEPGLDLRALDEGDLANAYRTVLHGKKVLLFLDNARSAEQIAPLRPPETCALLLTSRWTFSLPGLRSLRLSALSPEEAISFLLELCPRVGEAAPGLARACAYLPLALRIAGSFLEVNREWPLERYLAQLNDRRYRLASLRHSQIDSELFDDPDLTATFELSYNQLSEENQKRWRALGVFPASFDTSAAGAVWDMEEEETLKTLGLLRRYSLLEYDETASRYNLHDLLEDYALSKMDEGEERNARISHASYYSKVLGDINQMFLQGGENILPGLLLYDSEWINIQAGQQISVLYLEENREAAQACNWYAWQGSINHLRLKPTDRIRWIEAGIQASKVLGNKEAEAAHLGNLGLAYAALGDARKAIEFYEQRLEIACEIGDRRGEGNALGNLGIAYKNLGDARKAIEFYEQRMEIAREIGDRRGQGNALGSLGNAYADLGEARKAIELYEGQLVIAREIGDRRGQGNASWNLGLQYEKAGDLKKAIEAMQILVDFEREVGHPDADKDAARIEELRRKLEK